MSTISQTSSRKKVIIHHLADTYFGSSSAEKAFQAYKNYLAANVDQRPQLLVITGNASLSGTAQDFQNASQNLQSLQLPAVVVVPGPHDFSWQDPKRVFFPEFQAQMLSFGLPIFQDGLISPRLSQETYRIYVLDTCYHLSVKHGSLSVSGSNKLRDAEKEIVGDYANHFKRQPPMSDVAEFLKKMPKTEQSDGGRIMAEIVSRMMAMGPPANELQLSILATHHPLLPLIPGKEVQEKAYPVMNDATQIVQAIHRHQVHLLLHGHTHDARTMADVAFANDRTHTLVQVGAGSFTSLRDSAAPVQFNIITATRDEILLNNPAAPSPTQTQWWLEVKAEELPTTTRPATLFFVGAPTSDAINSSTKATEVSERQKRRSNFDLEVRNILNTLSEQVFATKSLLSMSDGSGIGENVLNLQEIFNAIRFLVTDMIFGKIRDLNVAFMLPPRMQKGNDGTEQADLPDFRYMHIYPKAIIDGNIPPPFPVSLAGWALFQGQIYRYPFDKDDELPLEWIRTHRWGILNAALKRELQLLTDANQPVNDPQIERIKNIIQTLERYGSNPRGPVGLTLKDIFVPVTTKLGNGYTALISVPIPLRPDGELQTEIGSPLGVLQIDLKENDSDKQFARSDFVGESEDLLQVVASLIYTVLTTDKALGTILRDRAEQIKGKDQQIEDLGHQIQRLKDQSPRPYGGT
jgi:hypothetical protein